MNRIEAPNLFSDPKAVTLGPGERLHAVSVPVSPEGVYVGDDKFQVPEDTIFRIVGFDKSGDEEEIWIGRGYIKK